MSNNSSQKVSLLKFISENEPSLTVAGIFIAIAAFWLNLPIKSLSTYIAFISILITLLIFISLQRQIGKINPSMGLLVFSNIFFLLIVFVFWYVLVVFRSQLKTELQKIVFLLFVIPLFLLYKNYIHHYLIFLVKICHRKFNNTLYLFTYNLSENLQRKRDLQYLRQLKRKNVPMPHIRNIINYIKDKKYNFKIFSKLSFEDIISIKKELAETTVDENQKKLYLIDIKYLEDTIKSEKHSLIIFHYALMVVAFILIAIPVDYASTGIANFLNTKLDSVYSSYEKQEPTLQPNRSLNPSPTPTPTPRDLPPQYPM